MMYISITKQISNYLSKQNWGHVFGGAGRSKSNKFVLKYECGNVNCDDCILNGILEYCFEVNREENGIHNVTVTNYYRITGSSLCERFESISIGIRKVINRNTSHGDISALRTICGDIHNFLEFTQNHANIPIEQNISFHGIPFIIESQSVPNNDLEVISILETRFLNNNLTNIIDYQNLKINPNQFHEILAKDFQSKVILKDFQDYIGEDRTLLLLVKGFKKLLNDFLLNSTSMEDTVSY